MRDFFCFAETLISGMLPFVFLVFSGIYFTVKSNFFQFKYLPSSVAYALGSIFKKRKKGEVTPFQAACTALSATVGTGNIAGVAGALLGTYCLKKISPLWLKRIFGAFMVYAGVRLLLK